MLKQWLLPQAGPANIFKLIDIDESFLSTVADEEVLIKVAYSGLNFADLHMRIGLYPDAPMFPFVPGYEVSGVVEKVGALVKHLKTGDAVISALSSQGYSSYVKSHQSLVTCLPERLNLAEGAASVVSFMTATAALLDYGNIQKGMNLLIDCASGSLGNMLCQLARLHKVEVVGLTSSVNKKDLIVSMGAQAFTHDEFKNINLPLFDIIINSYGGASVASHYERLSSRGQLILVGNSHLISSGQQNWFHYFQQLLSRRYTYNDFLASGRGLRGLNLNTLYDEKNYLGKNLQRIHQIPLMPAMDRIFSADELPSAHKYLEQKKSRGKVLIQWLH